MASPIVATPAAASSSNSKPNSFSSFRMSSTRSRLSRSNSSSLVLSRSSAGFRPVSFANNSVTRAEMVDMTFSPQSPAHRQRSAGTPVPASPAASLQGVADEVGGEVGGLEGVRLLLLAFQRPFHDEEVLHVDRLHPEDPGRALELRVVF